MKTTLLSLTLAALAAAAHAAPAMQELQALAPEAAPAPAPIAVPAGVPAAPRAAAARTITAKVSIGFASCTVSQTDAKEPALRGNAGFVDSSRSAGVLFIATEGAQNIPAALRVCEALKKIAGSGKVVEATAVEGRLVLTAVTIDGRTYSYTPVYK